MSRYKEPPTEWRDVQPPILPCDDCDATGERVRHHGPFVVTPVDCETCRGRGWLCSNGCALDACGCEGEDTHKAAAIRQTRDQNERTTS